MILISLNGARSTYLLYFEIFASCICSATMTHTIVLSKFCIMQPYIFNNILFDSISFKHRNMNDSITLQICNTFGTQTISNYFAVQ